MPNQENTMGFQEVRHPIPPTVTVGYASMTPHKVHGMHSLLSASTIQKYAHVESVGNPEKLDSIEQYTQNLDAYHLIAVAQLMGVLHSTHDIKVTSDVLMYVYTKNGWNLLLKPKDERQARQYLNMYTQENGVYDPIFGWVIKMAAIANVVLYHSEYDLGLLTTSYAHMLLHPFSYVETQEYFQKHEDHIYATNGGFRIQEHEFEDRIIAVGEASRNAPSFKEMLFELKRLLLGHPSIAIEALHMLERVPSTDFLFSDPHCIVDKIVSLVGREESNHRLLKKSRWKQIISHISPPKI